MSNSNELLTLLNQAALHGDFEAMPELAEKRKKAKEYEGLESKVCCTVLSNERNDSKIQEWVETFHPTCLSSLYRDYKAEGLGRSDACYTIEIPRSLETSWNEFVKWSDNVQLPKFC